MCAAVGLIFRLPDVFADSLEAESSAPASLLSASVLLLCSVVRAHDGAARGAEGPGCA